MIFKVYLPLSEYSQIIENQMQFCVYTFKYNWLGFQAIEHKMVFITAREIEFNTKQSVIFVSTCKIPNTHKVKISP